MISALSTLICVLLLTIQYGWTFPANVSLKNLIQLEPSNITSADKNPIQSTHRFYKIPISSEDGKGYIVKISNLQTTKPYTIHILNRNRKSHIQNIQPVSNQLVDETIIEVQQSTVLNETLIGEGNVTGGSNLSDDKIVIGSNVNENNKNGEDTVINSTSGRSSDQLLTGSIEKVSQNLNDITKNQLTPLRVPKPARRSEPRDNGAVIDSNVNPSCQEENPVDQKSIEHSPNGHSSDQLITGSLKQVSQNLNDKTGNKFKQSIVPKPKRRSA